jgi:hypothetical protein
VVSRIWTNIVRFAVAALLGLAACLVAWWPQSAAGSGDPAAVSAVAAAPTQNTPTPTKTPTATVAPTTAAPPPPAPPPAQPTHKPTTKPTHKPTHSGGSNGGNHQQPPTLHNNGGSSGGSHQSSGGSNNSNPPPPASTHSSAPYVPPAVPSTPVAPATHHTPSKPTATPTATPTAEAPTPDAQASPAAADTTKGADDAETYDTYLTSSEPVETKAAPVWVVPGILLVLTSMLALLGGVLGRGTRPALAPAKVSDKNASDDES